MKIAVISGGFSAEANTSRESAKCVAKALTDNGHKVSNIEYDENLISSIRDISPDVTFPLVQGKHHGDGAVQALLELAKIPYIGSRPHAAAVINNKTVCKKLWRAAGILTPDFFEYSHRDFLGFDDFECRVRQNGLKLPVVAKPLSEGNRFGMVFVKDSNTHGKLQNSFNYDDPLLIEAYVNGRFITQGLVEIGGKMTALPPMEVIDGTDDEFKLYAGGSAVKPCGFTQIQIDEITRTSLAAADLVGACGYARLDYHLCGPEYLGNLYLLEINAVPGLVPGYSSMTECAAEGGYSYGDFLELLLATAK